MADPTAEVNLMNTSSINPATVSRGAVTHHAYELYLSCDILTKAESRNICRQPKRRLLQIKNDIRQHIRWVVKNCEKYKNEPHNKKDQQWWHSQWGLQLSTQPVLLHLVSVICPMEKKEKKSLHLIRLLCLFKIQKLHWKLSQSWREYDLYKEPQAFYSPFWAEWTSALPAFWEYFFLFYLPLFFIMLLE